MVNKMKVKIIKGDKTDAKKEAAYQIIGEFIRSEAAETKAS
jgi:hypothetical protein